MSRVIFMKEKYFVDALIEKLSEIPYTHIEQEHRVRRNLDKRDDRRIDVLAYIKDKPFTFEVKSDEGDIWNGIEQAAYNKKILGVDNSYLVTGKKPNLEQMLLMQEEGIGCLFMPAPSPYSELFPIVKVGDKETDVMARYYLIWKNEQALKKKYGG